MNARFQQQWGPIVRSIYAACLLGATVNHALTVVKHGLFWDYGGVPVASAAFWTSLTFLDPLAAILCLTRANAGVSAALAIIVIDVVHNLWMTARYASPQGFVTAVVTNPFVVSQIVFMLFVVVTARVAWKPGRLQ
jgi:hypothetical protein